MREYWLVTGGDESKLKAVPEDGKAPELSDYFSPSEAQKQYELALIVGGLALTGCIPVSLGLKITAFCALSSV